MATQHKRKTNVRPVTALSTDVTTSAPSTAKVPKQTSIAQPYTTSVDTTSSTPSCHSSYVCGQQNTELRNRVDTLEKRIAVLEETAVDKRRFLKKAEGLLTVFKIVLIAMPVTLCVAIAIVQYFCYKDDDILNIVTSIIGLAAVADCIITPILWKSTADKVDKIESMMNE